MTRYKNNNTITFDTIESGAHAPHLLAPFAQKQLDGPQ